MPTSAQTLVRPTQTLLFGPDPRPSYTTKRTIYSPFSSFFGDLFFRPRPSSELHNKKVTKCPFSVIFHFSPRRYKYRCSCSCYFFSRTSGRVPGSDHPRPGTVATRDRRPGTAIHKNSDLGRGPSFFFLFPPFLQFIEFQCS